MDPIPVGSKSETVLKVTRLVQVLDLERRSDAVMICSSSVTGLGWQVLRVFFVCLCFMCPFMQLLVILVSTCGLAEM